jgi:hypothetical protein
VIESVISLAHSVRRIIFEFRRDCKQNGSWRPYDAQIEEATIAPEIRKRWEYENPEGEAELIAEQEQENV